MAREMKSSGIEWIGDIPSDWKKYKIKHIAKIYGRIGFRGYTTEDLVVEGEGAITLSPSNLCNMTMQYNKCTYISWEKYEESPEIKIFNGDILMVKTGSSYGKSSYVENLPSKATINPQLIVFKDFKISAKFLLYCFQTSYFLDQVENAIVGGTIPTMSQEKIYNFFVFAPHQEKQQEIVEYLDIKCAEIDAVIEKTKATIEEYKKLKQSVITEAVTKGIRGNRPMKDSGIEWIGDIPSDWEIRKLYRGIDRIGDIDHYMPESINEGIPYLMTGDLKEKLSEVKFDRCKMVSIDDYYTLSSKIKANKGDIIFARYATIGTVCFVDIEKEFLISYSCLIIKPTNNLLSGNFLFFYLKSTAFYEEVKQYINSNTQANIGIDSMSKAKIVLPSIEEQEEITNYLETKCAEIDALIAKKTNLLTELETYKKSLIYEYITGKKEVN